MADNEDQSSKTEEPTDRKLQKLRDDGQVPRSREVNSFFALLGALLLIGLVLPWQLTEVMNLTGAVLSQTGDLGGDDAGGLLGFVMQKALIAAIPGFILLVFLALFGSMVQTGGLLMSTKPIEPKLSKIALDKGFKRLFSLKSLMEFLKSFFKLAVLGVTLYAILYYFREEFLLLADKNVAATVILVWKIVLIMIAVAMVFMFVIAVIDYMYQRFEFMKEQKMSRKEIKDEMKDSEGDPHIKARQRQIMRERAQQRMMQDVPGADVVITNPTHYSVALQYDQEKSPAPIVVAKGVDAVALRIRTVAKEHNVPLYEDPPLARQLYADVEIGEIIPVDLYQTVAQVIAFVYRQKKKVG